MDWFVDLMRWMRTDAETKGWVPFYTWRMENTCKQWARDLLSMIVRGLFKETLKSWISPIFLDREEKKLKVKVERDTTFQGLVEKSRVLDDLHLYVRT